MHYTRATLMRSIRHILSACYLVTVAAKGGRGAGVLENLSSTRDPGLPTPQSQPAEPAARTETSESPCPQRPKPRKTRLASDRRHGRASHILTPRAEVAAARPTTIQLSQTPSPNPHCQNHPPHISAQTLATTHCARLLARRSALSLATLTQDALRRCSCLTTGGWPCRLGL